MNNINTGGPAFPEIRIRSGDNYNPPTKFYYGGMTLRDYFAATALPQLIDYYIAESKTYGFSHEWEVKVAMDAYAMADAMLIARAASAKAEGSQ